MEHTKSDCNFNDEKVMWTQTILVVVHEVLKAISVIRKTKMIWVTLVNENHEVYKATKVILVHMHLKAIKSDKGDKGDDAPKG